MVRFGLTEARDVGLETAHGVGFEEVPMEDVFICTCHFQIASTLTKLISLSSCLTFFAPSRVYKRDSYATPGSKTKTKGKPRQKSLGKLKHG